MQTICQSPKGHTFAVLGFGRAGRATTDWLLQKGASVLVYERNMPQDAAHYRAKGCEFYCGELPFCIGAEALVRSPGIRPDHPTILRSLANGAVLTSETELFLQHCPCSVIGITGSDGKTTTSALTAALLRAAGHHTLLGGNNGVPLLPCVDELAPDSFAVLELSSFQLLTVRKSPDVAVVTNISPNHLDWHTDIGEYRNAKRHIFAHGARRLVLRADSPLRAELCRDFGGELALFSAEEVQDPALFSRMGADELLVACEGEVLAYSAKGAEKLAPSLGFCLPGRHNLENLLCALGAVRHLVPYAAAQAAIADFRGVPHRLQRVGNVAGVTFINSSIDTSPSRTAAALSAVDGELVVIAGGKGKGLSMAALGDLFAVRASAVFLYGEMAEQIAQAVGGRVPTQVHTRFEDAFFAAAGTAKSGQTVLLSPACTAFDQFRDFEQRGEVFCGLVREWEAKKNAEN